MIRVDATKLREVEQQLGSFSNKAPTVISRALNRAAQNAKASTVSKLREEYILKAKDIRDTIKIRKATQRSLGAVVTSIGNKVPLIKFKVSPNKPNPQKPSKVLKAGVKKGGLKEIIGAFVANINGNKVFEREGKNRLPIKQLFGPSVPEMLGNESVKTYIEREATKMFDKRLEHEINRVWEVRK